jgi:hypothetical protein
MVGETSPFHSSIYPAGLKTCNGLTSSTMTTARVVDTEGPRQCKLLHLDTPPPPEDNSFAALVGPS